MLEKIDNYNVGLVMKKDKDKLHKIIIDKNNVEKKKKKKLNEIFEFKKNVKK